jgi:hypothetical protein
MFKAGSSSFEILLDYGREIAKGIALTSPASAWMGTLIKISI